MESKTPFKLSLASARKNAKLTQKQMAEMLGISRETVINWEKGKTYPTFPQMKKIEKITGIPIDYIFLI